MPSALSSSLRIAYDDLGSGETTLLMMPGWCGGRSVFTRLGERLSPRHRVVVLDWRGHGDSDPSTGRCGFDELTEDALAVIESSSAGTIVPVTMAHAGWVAIELARRLGPRVPAIVLIDWLLSPPPAFPELLDALASPDHWEAARDRLFAMWLSGTRDVEVERYVRTDMGGYCGGCWRQAAVAIGEAYRAAGTPLASLERLPPRPVLHVFAQPREARYLEAQQSYAASHPWFTPVRIEGETHFPPIEQPKAVAGVIDEFLVGSQLSGPVRG